MALFPTTSAVAPVYYWMHACVLISVVLLVKPKESMKEKLVTVSSHRAILEIRAYPPSPPLVEWMEEAGEVVFGGELCPFPGWRWVGGVGVGVGAGGETEDLCK